MPIEPYKPKYCRELTTHPPRAKVKKLCLDKKENNNESDDDSDEKNEVPGTVPRIMEYCDIAPNGNNFLNNGIRVGYNYPIEKCGEDENVKDDQCALFDSRSSTLSTYLENNNHLIKHCDDADSDEPCVNVDCDEIACPYKFRVMYQLVDTTNGDMLRELDSWVKLPTSTDQDEEVKPWGINQGQFADLYYTFETNGEANIYYWTPSDDSLVSSSEGVYLNHYEDGGATFKPTIAQREICVNAQEGDSNYEVGCRSRASPLIPTVEKCSDHDDICDNSDNTHARPKAVMNFNITPKRSDLPERTVKKVIKPHYAIDASNKEKEQIKEISALGKSYQIYVVDDEWHYIPRPDLVGDGNIFQGGISRFGKYKDENDNIVTRVYYDNGGSDNSGAPQDASNWEYFKGLEYVRNFYKRGGNKLCIEPQSNTEFKKDPPTEETLEQAKNATFAEEGDSSDQDAKIDFQKADEDGFCADIPVPSCPKITEDNADGSHGNATWPSTEFGTTVEGTCIPGSYRQNRVPKRNCGLDSNGEAKWHTVADNLTCEKMPVFEQISNDDDSQYCYKLNKIVHEDNGGGNHKFYLPDSERPNKSSDTTYSYYIKFTLNDSDANQPNPFKIKQIKPRGTTKVKFFRHNNNKIKNGGSNWDESTRNISGGSSWQDVGITNQDVKVFDGIFYIGIVTTGTSGPADIEIEGDPDHKFTLGCGKSE
jgi:hypothetical protein